MLSLKDALRIMLEQVTPQTKTEICPLSHAFERICAENVISPINVPAFDNSAMDGYAVRLADLNEIKTLPVAGTALAGSPFTGVWQPNTVIRIMTGAMIPEGTDAVVMQEKVQVNTDGSITFSHLPLRGENIRHQGDDIKKGEVVLTCGAKLTPRSLPLLASLGMTEIKVFKPLTVAVLATGDELVSVGKPLGLGQIYDINSFSIGLMLKKLGCKVLELGILPDDPARFEATFQQAQAQADLIISSGGVSVGEADFTRKVLEKHGQIHFWKIAIKPGKPFAFGQLGKTWFCGLPGNPVSALVTFHQLVQPLVAKLSGYSQWQAPQCFHAQTTVPLKKRIGRIDFQRGYFQLNAEGKLNVKSIGFQGSHMFHSLVQSNCFIVLEEARGNVDIGETVTIQPFDNLLG